MALRLFSWWVELQPFPYTEFSAAGRRRVQLVLSGWGLCCIGVALARGDAALAGLTLALMAPAVAGLVAIDRARTQQARAERERREQRRESARQEYLASISDATRRATSE